MKQFIRREWVAEPETRGMRLDQALAGVWSDFSRSRITTWVREGELTVDGAAVKPNLRLNGGEQILLEARIQARNDSPAAQAIELDVKYHDDQVLVINKPAGLVVHPGSGNTDGTLVNALLHLDPGLEILPRAGLVHRLDKDTSGCLLVARTFGAHHHLIQAMKDRNIKRIYRALVWGTVIAGGTIEANLGRHPVDRRRQSVTARGRRAVTHYRVSRRVAGGTVLEVMLETGRTHQIRVHMAHAGFPIVGDPMYGRRGTPAGLTEVQRVTWRDFRRQALHAAQLTFPHPRDGREITVTAPMPGDLQQLIEMLAVDGQDEQHSGPGH